MDYITKTKQVLRLFLTVILAVLVSVSVAASTFCSLRQDYILTDADSNVLRITYGLYPVYCFSNSNGHSVPSWLFVSESHMGELDSHYQQYEGYCIYCGRKITRIDDPECTEDHCNYVAKQNSRMIK